MNWGEIKTAVQQYLQNSEVTFLANLPLIVRLAEEDIYRKVQLPVGKQLATAPLFVNDEYVTLPAGLLSINSIAIIDPVSNELTYLLPKDFAFLREAFPDPTEAGQPRYYGWRDEVTLRIAPVPNAVYGAEIHYFRQPFSIGENNNNINETWLSTFAENALIFGILYHGYIYEKGDQDVITAYKTQFDTAIEDLKTIAEGRQQKDTYRQVDTRVPT